MSPPFIFRCGASLWPDPTTVALHGAILALVVAFAKHVITDLVDERPVTTNLSAQ